MASWITFALMVSLMFGISFQLPLVMLFLEKISLVSVTLYREKRRHAILIIAFLSMVLTPSDPVSMMMMMVPLCVLYELGILLCSRSAAAKTSPFEAQPA
jgi:sec-independent protein translocase protein TatC